MESIRTQENLLKATDLSGIIVPLMTPFIRAENGFGKIVDVESQDRQIDRLMSAGVHGIFLGSNAGEGRVIDVDNWKLSIKEGIKSVKKRDADLPVVVGVLRENIEEVMELAKFAEENGADAIVLAPGFTHADPYLTVNKVIFETKIPIVLYNNPEFHNKIDKVLDDNNNLPIDFLKSIQSNRVIGVKDTSRKTDYFAELLKLRNFNTFHVFQGDTGTGDFFNCDGMVPVEANIWPEALISLWEEGNKTEYYDVLEYFRENKKTGVGTLRLIINILNQPNPKHPSLRIFDTNLMYSDV